MKTIGDTCERLASSWLHEQGLPVLIAPGFLRKNECGQVDLCIINEEKKCKIYELKSYFALSPSQSLRVVKSSLLISRTLGMKADCFAWFFKDKAIFPLN